MDVGSIKSLLKQTYDEWSHDEIPRLAAALAYYTAFSRAPLLVVVISVAGLALGQAHVQEQILAQLRGLLGDQGAALVGTMLESALRPREALLPLVLSLIAVMMGASGLVVELRSALNTVWDVQPRPGRGLMGVIKNRFLSFALVLVVGFLLLVTLVLSAALAGLRGAVVTRVGGLAPLFRVVGFVVDFLLTTVLIALIFRFLPDVRLRWRDVAPGAAVTSLLFAAGKIAIGFYLGRAAVGLAYGGAGSLAIVLLWVYYSAQILLMGAEFTQVWARGHGAWIQPKADADSTRTTEGKCAAAPANPSVAP
jgi:membrane protein